MEPFTSHTGIAAPLAMADVNTDIIYPQRFLRLIGCHESSRQKEEAAMRLHA